MYYACLSIDTKLCSSPMSSLGIVSNFVISFVTEPVWKRSVLFGLLDKSLLDLKTFYSTLREI